MDGRVFLLVELCDASPPTQFNHRGGLLNLGSRKKCEFLLINLAIIRRFSKSKSGQCQDLYMSVSFQSKLIYFQKSNTFSIPLHMPFLFTFFNFLSSFFFVSCFFTCALLQLTVLSLLGEHNNLMKEDPIDRYEVVGWTVGGHDFRIFVGKQGGRYVFSNALDSTQGIFQLSAKKMSLCGVF